MNDINLHCIIRFPHMQLIAITLIRLEDFILILLVMLIGFLLINALICVMKAPNIEPFTFFIYFCK